jgi:hypothetical protein
LTAFTFYRNPKARQSSVNAIAIPEGFAFGGFLLGPLWFLNCGAPLIAALDVLLSAAVLYSDRIVDLTVPELLILGLLLRLCIGFEARNLLRLSLEWRGYRLDGVVMATDIEAAEARYFSAPEKPQRDSGPAGGAALDALAQRLGRRAP